MRSATLTEDPDYDLFCQQRLHDPYPLLARLRDEDPIHFCEPMKMWLVTRYEDVYEGVRNTTRLSSSRNAMYSEPLLPQNSHTAEPVIRHLTHWILNIDPPRHTRLRKLINIAFTPRMLHSLIPGIEQLVGRYLDDASQKTETDFIPTFAFPLPAMVISQMLGIPEGDTQISLCANVRGLELFSAAGGSGLNQTIDHAAESLSEMIDLFDQLIVERRKKPQKDLISALVSAQDNGDRLNRDELHAMCVFVFTAGHGTTAGLLSNGMLALLQNPDQFKALKANPDGLIESAIEEFLRYESPVARAVRRAKCDFEWRGKTILKGQTVVNLIGAANRDPRQFENPDHLDITRSPNKHLAFGYGIHFCIGAPLARIEANIAFRAILQRFPNMQLATDCLTYKSAMGIRSLESLPVRFG